MTVHLWLRGETKPNEKRSALTPSIAATLLASGFKITVEECEQRIFDDSEFEKVGCTMVAKGSWKTDAPKDAYILGLKELPENEDFPLVHSHIMFAHCYKQQEGWKDVLGRFANGNGLLLDLEFLQKNGRRVAAFGYYAGFAGSAVGFDVLFHRLIEGEKSVYPKINPYPNEDELVNYLKKRMEVAVQKLGRLPRIMVMGALGRCGTGACDFARRIGVPEENIIKWDMAETAAGGPFKEILSHDIFVNCIYLSKPIPPFITKEMLSDEKQLSVVVDVSCDATNPHNPIPIYHGATTFDKPLINVSPEKGAPVEIVAIDHLPTLLPREASEAFVKDLLPSLLELPNRQESSVWADAETLYHDKVKLL